MLDDFLTRAVLAGLGVAIVAGPLGCFVVWRRMAYFGDATAHSALLGVALGLAFDLPILLGTLMVVMAMTAAIAALSQRSGFAADTLLGVMAHASLAFGVVAISQTPGIRVDLVGYLFGDILAVTPADLALIWIGAVMINAVLFWRWRGLLNMTLNEALSVAEGRSPAWDRAGLMVSLALAVAIAMQITGLLLVTAMLILPAAASRPLSRTPEAMAILAALLGAASVFFGVAASFQLDAPTGPTIVVVLFGLFCATLIVGKLSNAFHANRSGELNQPER